MANVTYIANTTCSNA